MSESALVFKDVMLRPRSRFRLPTSSFERLLTSAHNHTRQIEIHLLGETGERPHPAQPLPRVSSIKARVYRSRIDLDETVRPALLNIQDLFFSCPNLTSCYLAMEDGHTPSGSMTYNYFDTFELKGDEVFPPLRHLSLDGRYIGEDEWPHWRDRFPWPTLSSLEIGPQSLYLCRTLDQMTGHARFLKTLKLKVLHGKGEIPCESLERFLSSFDTLETLELRNYSCSVGVITQHTRLRHLYRHIDESWESQQFRDVLSSEDLEYLDTRCPHLETMELDIERQDDHWVS